MKAFDLLRALVSQEKERYVEGGFDLDLTYITPRVIAMGFPSVGFESYYRNPMSEVERFLTCKHPNRHRVYNLCCERSYSSTCFGGNAVTYGFIDHTPPPLDLLTRCCEDMQAFLNADPDNVCVVHCKAGKGRTGVVVCAFLLLSGVCADVDEAMELYARRRTRDGQGITIPSQRRFVGYFAQCVVRGAVVPPPPKPVRLLRIVISPAPCTTPADLNLRIFGLEHTEERVTGQTVLHEQDGPPTLTGDDVVFEMPSPVLLDDGFDVRLKKKAKSKPLLHFFLNTRFIGNAVALEKAEIDGPHLDRDHSAYAATMTITCHFAPLSLPEMAIPSDTDPTDFAPASPLSPELPAPVDGEDSDFDRYDRDP
jgi:phosphatidylinositol-3,4,5-trisphosphate 3-phosphatase/dual-specificity protein phosphatase PTEN